MHTDRPALADRACCSHIATRKTTGTPRGGNGVSPAVRRGEIFFFLTNAGVRYTSARARDRGPGAAEPTAAAAALTAEAGKLAAPINEGSAPLTQGAEPLNLVQKCKILNKNLRGLNRLASFGLTLCLLAKGDRGVEYPPRRRAPPELRTLLHLPFFVLFCGPVFLALRVLRSTEFMSYGRV